MKLFCNVRPSHLEYFRVFGEFCYVLKEEIISITNPVVIHLENVGGGNVSQHIL